MRFCCWFKLSKKIEKLSNEQPTHAITNCTLTGLVQKAKKSHWKWDLKSRMCISHNIASSFHRHMHRLEIKMPLPPVKKQKTPACIKEIQVHKRWTKVYSQKGLTAICYWQSAAHFIDRVCTTLAQHRHHDPTDLPPPRKLLLGEAYVLQPCMWKLVDEHG